MTKNVPIKCYGVNDNSTFCKYSDLGYISGEQVLKQRVDHKVAISSTLKWQQMQTARKKLK